VILAPLAVGGSNIAHGRRAARSTFHDPARPDLARIIASPTFSGTRRIRLALRTDPAQYKERFLSFADTYAPTPSTRRFSFRPATRCLPGWSALNPIRAAQHELVSIEPGFKAGVDHTDLLLSAQDRYDDCHMRDSGEVKSARAWARF